MKPLSATFVAVLACPLALVAISQGQHTPANPPKAPAGVAAPSAPAAPAQKAAAAQAQFESLKKLAGEWHSKAGHGEMGNDVSVIYKVTSAGSTVMETLFVGTDHEMITMYTMDGDDLVLTHYCSMGNQPHMKAAAPDPKNPSTISFACTGHGGNIKNENDAHMHAAQITITDANHITSKWTMQADGKPGESANFELERKTK